MSVARFKIAFGGKLAEQLEPAIAKHRLSNDPISQSLVAAWDTRGTISRGGGVQSRMLLSVDEVKVFLNDVSHLYRAHSGVEEILDKAQRNRLVGIQANRTKKQLENVLATASA